MKIDEETVRKKLISLMNELETLSDLAADNRKPIELDQQSVGRLSRLDSLQVQAMDMAQEKSRRRKIEQIKAALERLDSGDYGFCASCDEEIGAKRLQIAPAIPLCVNCAK